MRIIKAPNRIIYDEDDGCKIFLAGSIEMGKADNWQQRLTRELKRCIVLNPRRDDWDSSWVQKIDNPKFREQVEWELEAMDLADIIVMYFDPSTKSPISLLELGLYADSGKLIVFCPEGFWRKGNVDIVCRKYNIPMMVSEQDLILTLQQRI
jgi:hypothetical protein